MSGEGKAAVQLTKCLIYGLFSFQTYRKLLARIQQQSSLKVYFHSSIILALLLHGLISHVCCLADCTGRWIISYHWMYSVS